ncbi:phosphonate C-P lyase system protein PhnH [Phaeobacter gallaeciensis]|uniref:phosphonate C-P lyase system protein PhnH n=1 Tax=Phaeobacter gallaeciensis TaxID=60890 RepID=UPI000BBCF353|nr:phosphonate C-P lyase system protein PhnH [Phaeobacter gallaeciensis]ATF19545.1 phosphonate C-P lyase system protein PhnH [Phaeobacter gallaeciensis]ATF23654.1 phosphonate C-P lyase system protein PhnH [Phaeobacter gallaeciensis]
MSSQTQASHFSGGFTAPPIQSAKAFRAAMTAMARPGEIKDITGTTPPEGLSVAAGCLLLTLCDPDTSLYLASDVDRPAVRDWITFHTGAPFVRPEQADFAIGGWSALTPLDRYRIGTSEYPDRSATLIVELPSFNTPNAELRGPGIKASTEIWLPDIGPFQANSMLFPLGFDTYFTAGSRICALPRSSQITPLAKEER